MPKYLTQKVLLWFK